MEANLFLSLASSWQGLCRLIFSLGRRAPYYETTDARNMEFDNNANEKVNEYMAREFKTGCEKGPPPSRRFNEYMAREIKTGYDNLKFPPTVGGSDS